MTAPTIDIDFQHEQVLINGKVLRSHDLSNIKEILGQPSRIKEHHFTSYYKEMGYDGMPPTSTPMPSTNYYYIYDELGLVFYSQNGGFKQNENPRRWAIFLNNERTFSNTAPLPFTPKKTFTGELKINGNAVLSTDDVVPNDVNYRTHAFELWGLSFGTTSITTVIDGLYLVNSASPYLRIFLDSPEKQRISYIEITQKE